MADGKKNRPLSLNQLNNRVLLDLSASQSKRKPVPPSYSSSFKGTDENDSDTQRSDDVPSFDICSSSPHIRGKPDVDEHLSKSKDSSPNLFAGIADFDSPSSSLEKDTNTKSEATMENSVHDLGVKLAQAELEPTKRSGKEDKTKKTSVANVADIDSTCLGEEKTTKLKIQGRRRLCKISKNSDTGDGADERPKFNDISDFDSPAHTNKACENAGSEIRDILNDLTSRLEIMSIEKKRVPKKADSLKDFPDLSRSKLYNVSIKDEAREYKAAVSSTPSSDYVSLSESPNVEQVDLSKGDVIDLSDDEPDDVTVSDDFTLTGPKGTYQLPSKIATMLFPHQREGLKWLWSLHCKGKGGILGDDMGLGKTMQICGFLAGLFHSNLVKRVLVVAPKTLLTHWGNELATVGLSGKTREYFATCAKLRHYELQYVLQDKGVLLTTYDIVRNNVKSLCGDIQNLDDGDEDETTWDYIILDEGHLIKNPSTQRAKSLLQIPCRHRIIISGTPLQNNLKELWALFNFCCPELLGDKKEFKEKYEHYINRGNEKNASDREKRIGSSVAKDLRDCIQPYFLRRMKSEVFTDETTLSKKNEVIIWLKLTGCQRQLYEAFLNSEIVVSACDGSPLAALTILKKICDHPLLLTKRAAEDVLEGMDSIANQEDHRVAEKLAMHIADVAERFDIVENHDISCKISFIMSLLGDLLPKGHNVLIFSQTRKMLNILQESLMSRDYKYMRIDGTTKASDRAQVVKDFQEGRGAPIFLLTSQVGGLGLTLTKADRVIVVDPAWNPSTDNQSVDRAYRIGQKKDVIVYRLMTCGTVEEKIYRKQVFKGGLFRRVTEQKEQIRYFSQQDLRDLFSLPSAGFDVSLTQKQLLEEHDQQHIMEETLRVHVEFLKTLNIAGVSQHSLLFSKTAHVPAAELEDEPERLKRSTFTGNTSRRTAVEHDVDGAKVYAFNPKEAKKFQRNSSPSVTEPSESEIKDRINRLFHILENKVAISRLPDQGQKIQKQINALTLQLGQVRLPKENKEVHVISP